MRRPVANGARGRAKRLASSFALALALMPAAAQTAGSFFFRPLGEVFFPLDKTTKNLTGELINTYETLAFGGGMAVDYVAMNWLTPFARAEFVNAPYNGSEHVLQSIDMNGGLGFTYRPFDRLALRLDGMAGIAEIRHYDSDSLKYLWSPFYSAGGRLGLDLRLAPGLTVSASGGFTTYMGSDFQSFFNAVEAGLYLTIDFTSLSSQRARVEVTDVKLDAVFPSLYAYYDDNAFGTVKVVNREDGSISDVKVSFNAGHYMDQPKVCGEYPSIAKGGSVTVPVKALFTDEVLKITQGTDAKGEIIVDYTYLGSDRNVRVPIDFRMHHRNAITWSDDRRAASFVSPTNPAALWFSKYAAGVVRDRMRGEINKPLQYAIGMFEAERMYGLNYVVVPANDYSVKHGLKDYIDSVQFPHQTLANRGGDCSDLAILFGALMQSVGVEAAFITIPGHIFAAFDTGLDEVAGRETFYDPGLLIYRDGKSWVPVEITMVKDGFIKAWRVAAKEYYDNLKTNTAAFYRLPECWKVYPPAAFPDVNPRFTLPDEADTAAAFDGALDRYVAREIEPKVDALAAKVGDSDPRLRDNELGILYARYGMVKDAWKKLSESAKAGYQNAWTNVGNIAFLRKEYKIALTYYEWSLQLNPADDYALLGVARCQYELEDFKASDAAYAQLVARNPALAGKFGYLASVFGGEGRAWSLSDRFDTSTWATARPETVSEMRNAAFLKPIVASADTMKRAPLLGLDLPGETETKGRSSEEESILLAKAPAEPSASQPAAPGTRASAPAAKPAFDAAAAKAEADKAEAAKVAAAKVEAAKAEAAKAEAAKAEAAKAEAAKVAAAKTESEKIAAAKAEAAKAAADRQAVEKARAAQDEADRLAAEKRATDKAAQLAAQPAPEPQVVEVAAQAPAQTVSESERQLLVQGFSTSSPVMGAWSIVGGVAKQTDPDQFYAKLLMPLAQQITTAFDYSFVATSKARGRGWVGVGSHLFTPKTYTNKGYGNGDSLCVWLTRDPVHYKQDITRLQLYRSTDDWNMKLLAETPVSESIYDPNRFDIRVDPVEGRVTVSLNGTERLVQDGIRDLHEGVYVALRALDTAEFSEFKVESDR